MKISSEVVAGLSAVRQRLALAEQAGRRQRDAVALLAVSKRQSATAIAACYAAGQLSFGESYLQEAITKMETLSSLPIDWHFIGRIQANKTAELARHFSWVQSVDRGKIARRLAEQRPSSLPPLNVCVQVNISNDPAKAGVTADQASALCEQVQAFSQLSLRGLMAIPLAQQSSQQRCQEFARLRQLYRTLQEQGFALDTLSMGMSDDLEEAVIEGATMVRVGSALFGLRGE